MNSHRSSLLHVHMLEGVNWREGVGGGGESFDEKRISHNQHDVPKPIVGEKQKKAKNAGRLTKSEASRASSDWRARRRLKVIDIFKVFMAEFL